MSEAAQSTVWLTQEAYDKLAGELEFLKGEGRRTVSAKIAQARDEGDLSENGGYHAAREELALNDARAAELRAKLEKAKVGTPEDDGVVEAGMVVTVEPGLYLENRYGIRIEDTVAVTEAGCEILNGISKELTIL